MHTDKLKHPVPVRRKSAFSSFLDTLDPERDAQQREHQIRLRQSQPQQKPPTPPQPVRKQKPITPPKAKKLTFDEQLALTQKWLENTFPNLFNLNEPKPLDIHILRDLKQHYKHYQLQRKYPPDLPLRAAFNLYMESPQYLAVLKEGAPRYNIQGKIGGPSNR